MSDGASHFDMQELAKISKMSKEQKATKKTDAAQSKKVGSTDKSWHAGGKPGIEKKGSPDEAKEGDVAPDEAKDQKEEERHHRQLAAQERGQSLLSDAVESDSEQTALAASEVLSVHSYLFFLLWSGIMCMLKTNVTCRDHKKRAITAKLPALLPGRSRRPQSKGFSTISTPSGSSRACMCRGKAQSAKSLRPSGKKKFLSGGLQLLSCQRLDSASGNPIFRQSMCAMSPSLTSLALCTRPRNTQNLGCR